jgi:hypothetical protein
VLERMPDQRLAHFYENIRQQIEADRMAVLATSALTTLIAITPA